MPHVECGEARGNMSLRAQYTPLTKVQTISILVAVFAIVVQPTYGLVSAQVAYAQSADITQIAFTSSVQTVNGSDKTSVMTVQLQNANGGKEVLTEPGANIVLSSDSTTGQFSEDGATGWAASAGYSIDNALGEKSFSYKDTTAGTPTIIAKVTGGGIGSALPPTSQTIFNPTISIDSPSPGSTFGVHQPIPLTGLVSDGTGPGIKEVHIQVNAGQSMPAIVQDGKWSVTIPADTLSEGVDIEIIATATDDVNNSISSSPTKINVDGTAPVPTISFLSPASPTANDSSITLGGRVDNANDLNKLGLYRNGSYIDDLTMKNDGTWSYIFTGPFTQGTYNFSVHASDNYNNISDVTAPSANMKVYFGQYIAPIKLAINSDSLLLGLTGPNTFKTITPTPTPIANDIASNTSSSNSNAFVLGAQDKKTDTPLAKTGAIEPSTQGWKIFGMAWFWWLLVAAVAVSAWLWLAAAIRRHRAAA